MWISSTAWNCDFLLHKNLSSSLFPLNASSRQLIRIYLLTGKNTSPASNHHLMRSCHPQMQLRVFYLAFPEQTKRNSVASDWNLLYLQKQNNDKNK